MSRRLVISWPGATSKGRPALPTDWWEICTRVPSGWGGGSRGTLTLTARRPSWCLMTRLDAEDLGRDAGCGGKASLQCCGLSCHGVVDPRQPLLVDGHRKY